MSSVVIHKCKTEGVTSDAYKRTYGWELDEIPLRVTKKRDGSTKNEFCPNCGEPTEDMDRAPAEEALKLDHPIGGSAYKAGNFTNKAEAGDMMREIKKMRAQIDDLSKSKKGNKGGSD